MEEGCRNPAAYLPDDLVVEILSRLPAKSLCRFKCVSRSWRALIFSDRFSFAQTLSGFFFGSRRDIAGLPPPLPGVDTALSFLPPSGGEIELLDSCNGLLLLLCSREPGSSSAIQSLWNCR
ncbi:putative F-box protein At4g09190 [Panicum virgatum]|uniref:putative F-box protein At4g09190 n=1 Tax=Panicum virgatum TaxID=38727 RepID=UPI0019D5777B|nr:putative F-box protein At4g09190 [Panicum virgatum]